MSLSLPFHIITTSSPNMILSHTSHQVIPTPINTRLWKCYAFLTILTLYLIITMGFLISDVTELCNTNWYTNYSILAVLQISIGNADKQMAEKFGKWAYHVLRLWPSTAGALDLLPHQGQLWQLLNGKQQRSWLSGSSCSWGLQERRKVPGGMLCCGGISLWGRSMVANYKFGNP